MNHILKGLAFSVSVVLTFLIGNHAVAAEEFEATKTKIESTLGLEISAVDDSPIPGLIQLVTDRGVFYASKDGTYFLQAKIFNLDENMHNETEKVLSELRLKGISEFQDSTIEFKAQDEKYVVYVFSDITCGYCRKLHNEIAKYNNLGITVRYLAFPRAGIVSKTGNEMMSVWCSENKQEAMSAAKAGDQVLVEEFISTKMCAKNVEKHYKFGLKVGVTGTPNIILPNGAMISYQPPLQLEKILKDMK